MLINHNFYIKLVPLVIFIYDARSHIHQISIIYLHFYSREFAAGYNASECIRQVSIRNLG